MKRYLNNIEKLNNTKKILENEIDKKLDYLKGQIRFYTSFKNGV